MMRITPEIIRAINKGAAKIKTIEAKYIPKEFRQDSGWLRAVNDVVNRTALSIRDELEKVIIKPS